MPDGPRYDGPRYDGGISADHFSALMSACGLDNVKRVCVAVSGGADSMALCLLAAGWARRRGVDLQALSVDHGLRAESAQEIECVRAWLGERHIPHHVLQWLGGRDKTSSLQQRARAARYALMTDWAKANGFQHIMVAHHLEDQAETVLMRLSKGSTLIGLAAMAPVRDLAGVSLVRPLLNVPKARLRATLTQCGQNWIEDPSNQNPVFERVRAREMLGQLDPSGQLASRLAGVARSCGKVRSILDRAAEDVLAQGQAEAGGFVLPKHVFVDAPETLRELVLSRLLQTIGARTYPPSPDKCARAARWMVGARPPGACARTLAGCEVRLKKRGNAWAFYVTPEKPRRSGLKNFPKRVKNLT